MYKPTKRCRTRLFGAGQRVPSVILYKDRQIRDVKNFCFAGANGSVLAVDKTYNLGAIYCTVTVYKNTAVLRCRSGDHPVFAGPLILHGHSDMETYSFFFGHLASRLADATYQFGHVTIGTDEEAALIKAIMCAFPSVKHISCSRHLKENTARKLDSLLGSPDPKYRDVQARLFGDDGLVSNADTVGFEAAVDTFWSESLHTAPPAFQQYFDTQLLTLLQDNVAAGRAGWTNNNCESFNHVLKQSIQWCPQHLPELTEKLRQVVCAQFSEAERALLGLGHLMLDSSHVRHRLTPEVWQRMSLQQRQHVSNKCFRLQPLHVSTSTDSVLRSP